MIIERDTGGPAFPMVAENGLGHVSEGMMLRDYFAAKAMQGLISNLTYGGELQRIFDEKKAIANAGKPSETPHDYIARLAMTLADAMLEARKK